MIKDDDVKEVKRRYIDDPSLNLFTGISSCIDDGHVHVTRNPGFISKLLLLAEPDNSGLDKERHAKTMVAAQKELLICISITLSKRFQKIQQRLREGEQTCDLLSLVALMTLRKSCDMCIERKRNNVDLDELCNMIEQTDRDREERQARKREKKTKQKQKKREMKAAVKEEKTEDSSKSCDQVKDCQEGKKDPASANMKDAPDTNIKKKPKCKKMDEKRLKKENRVKRKNSHVQSSCDSSSAGPNNADDSDSGLSCAWSGNASPVYARGERRYSHGAWMKGGSPDLGLEEWEFAKHECTASKQGTSCNMVVPGSGELLETDSSDDEDPILLSQEEIKEFLSMFPQLNSQREQLRKNLRERFEAFCATCNAVGTNICWKHEPRGY